MGDDGDDDREAASEARQDLLAIVAHDLRNPLGSILTAAGLLARLDVPAPDGDKLRKYTAIVQRAGERMDRWISDLHELTLIDGGAISLVRGTIQARALVEDAVGEHEPAAAAKQIGLHAEVRADPGGLFIDRHHVRRVLSNLIGNAIKATPAGGAITVVADQVDGVPTLSVRDTGPGIAAALVPRLFEPYWQSRRRLGAGSGLGLSIAKGLVEAHGGTLRVDTAPGDGATFTFTLPRAG